MASDDDDEDDDFNQLSPLGCTQSPEARLMKDWTVTPWTPSIPPGRSWSRSCAIPPASQLGAASPGRPLKPHYQPDRCTARL
ncbi:jg26718 [Pararge aegeria aegeria]|uniref:Jg26718 protein n=1 Tax=Pararge aegeria aegeria TaxID=348720 RepID=A0A8S4QK70_9NEOP|nr:jg26718 [Pararge aegeria aegeria]